MSLCTCLIHQCLPLRKHRIQPHGGEERLPVARTALKMVKAVADIGDDTIDVHHEDPRGVPLHTI